MLHPPETCDLKTLLKQLQFQTHQAIRGVITPLEGLLLLPSSTCSHLLCLHLRIKGLLHEY